MSIIEKIQQLRSVYDEIDRKVNEFYQATTVACLPDCGECCQRFEPYISVLEALIVVDYMKQNSHKQEQFTNHSPEKDQTLCPFYDPTRDYRCTIYAFRPLICRLFSYSANRVPTGIRYSPCHRMKDEFADSLEKIDKQINQDVAIPVYQEVFSQALDIDFLLATDLHPFRRSIQIALDNWDRIESGEYQQELAAKKDSGPNFSQYVRNFVETSTNRQVGNHCTPKNV